ncbi:MAG: transaldolase [Deltaproteobacteria bacterium]
MASSLLKQLYQFGQSPWYDNIDRRLIASGELKSFFERGIVGVTSNPTIFEKAVKGSDVYDGKIKRLKAQGADTAEICEVLTTDDVRDAADLLREVYERTQGVDGWVSIEVSPAYAHDAQKTIAHGQRLINRVDRPNIMIKVPGTVEGGEAVAALIAQGISVNVTLLFSRQHYLRAAQAYWQGLEELSRTGARLDSVASVASVFVSRIDTKVDGLLDVFSSRQEVLEKRTALEALRGRAAIANTRMIYQDFKSFFTENKFGPLKMLGARPQRPLWASTSTKNPAYGDCLYVDSLIGPMTVNTMPHATVLAFEDHGKPALTLEQGLGEDRDLLKALAGLGIEIDKICEETQVEGIRAFETSFDALLKAIEEKAG